LSRDNRDLMLVRMRVLMIREMAMNMCVRLSRWRELVGSVGVRCLQMARVVVTHPALRCSCVDNQQAFAVVPAISKKIKVLFALCLLLIRREAIPLTMRMLNEAAFYIRKRYCP
jgi:hypothetical protein